MPSNISDSFLSVDTQRIQLNLNTNNITKQIEAGTELGFNLLLNEVEGEEVIFTSLDENIVTVNNTGLVTAKAYGTTQIEVSTNKLPNKALVTVEVLRKDDIAIPKVVAGRDHYVSLKADGTVWTWGYNGYGQLGTEDTQNRHKPTKINVENIIDVSAGEYFTLLLSKDGTVYSFGANSYYQLGRTEDPMKIQKVEGLENVIGISAGTYHSMAITKQGVLYTWGYKGQLGTGDTSIRITPIKTRLKGIAKIDANYQISGAVDGNGNLYLWGDNGYGQLGNGTTTALTVPTVVTSLENVIDVAIEEYTVIALTKDGTVWSSGYNSYGNLGNNTTTGRITFDKVIEKYEETTNEVVYLTNTKSIEAGYENAIAVKEDGTAVAWGYNSYGQFANGTTSHSYIGTQLKYGSEKEIINEIYDVALTDGGIAIVRNDGRVWTNGENGYGQIGDSSIVARQEFTCISKTKIKFEDSPIKIKGLNVTKDTNVNLEAGFNLFYNKMEETDFEFSIKNSEIATVNIETGAVTSVKKGKTQLTANEKITAAGGKVEVV